MQLWCIFDSAQWAHPVNLERSRKKNSFVSCTRSELQERRSNPIPKACPSLRSCSRKCSDLASARIAIHPSLELPWPCRRPQVVRLTSRKVDVSRFSRDNLMGPLTNSHARVWMRRAQSLSFPRLLDASDCMRKAVGASLHLCFWLMSAHSVQTVSYTHLTLPTICSV